MPPPGPLPGQAVPSSYQATATTGGEGLHLLESTTPHGARSRLCRYSRSTSTDESQPPDRHDHLHRARTPPSGPIALSLAGATARGGLGRSCPLLRMRLRRAPIATVTRQPTPSNDKQTAAAAPATRPGAVAGGTGACNDCATPGSRL